MTVKHSSRNILQNLNCHHVILRLVAQRVFTCVVIARSLCIHSLASAWLLMVCGVKDAKLFLYLIESLGLNEDILQQIINLRRLNSELFRHTVAHVEVYLFHLLFQLFLRLLEPIKKVGMAGIESFDRGLLGLLKAF